MADDAALVDLAFDAYSKLDGLSADISAMRQDQLTFFHDVLSALVDDEPVLLTDDEPVLEAVALVDETYAPDAHYYEALLGFEWAQTITGVFILVALLLSLGVQLWGAFSDKWR